MMSTGCYGSVTDDINGLVTIYGSVTDDVNLVMLICVIRANDVNGMVAVTIPQLMTSQLLTSAQNVSLYSLQLPCLYLTRTASALQSFVQSG